MEEKKIFEKRWQLATSEQRTKFDQLVASYPRSNGHLKKKDTSYGYAN